MLIHDLNVTEELLISLPPHIRYTHLLCVTPVCETPVCKTPVCKTPVSGTPVSATPVINHQLYPDDVLAQFV